VRGWEKSLACRQHIEIGLALGLALIEQESGGDEDAVSPAGAIGLTQLMPATAAELGVDPHDPSQNVRGGFRHLIRMLRFFKSVELALAAYNCGQGRVARLLKEQQAETFDAIEHLLPDQTRRYVPSVLAKMDRILSKG